MLRRRATWGVAFALLICLSVVAISSYSGLRNNTRLMEVAATATIDPALGLCEGRACYSVSTPPGLSDQAVLREHYVSHFKQTITRTKQEMSAAQILYVRANVLGSGIGIVLLMALAATLSGAEWRWGTLQAKLAYQPRRFLLLSAHLVATGLVLSFVALAAMIGIGVVDQVMRWSLDIPFGSLGDLPPAGAYAAGAVFILLAFGTVAAAFATWFRSSLAGLIGPGVLIVLDDQIVQRFRSLRGLLPSQQVLGLLSVDPFHVPEGTVWWRPVGFTECIRTSCTHIIEPLLSPVHSLAVLAGWTLVFATLTLWWVQRRDLDVRRA